MHVQRAQGPRETTAHKRAQAGQHTGTFPSPHKTPNGDPTLTIFSKDTRASKIKKLHESKDCAFYYITFAAS